MVCRVHQNWLRMLSLTRIASPKGPPHPQYVEHAIGTGASHLSKRHNCQDSRVGAVGAAARNARPSDSALQTLVHIFDSTSLRTFENEDDDDDENERRATPGGAGEQRFCF